MNADRPSHRAVRRAALLTILLAPLAACGSAEVPPAAVEPERAPTVFDPMTSTIDRARGVQNTVDEQAAEQRRRIEEASR